MKGHRLVPPWEREEPRAMIRRTGAREWGPSAWEAWVEHGFIKYAGEYGTYAWSRQRAEKKAHRLLRKYLKSRPGPSQDITPGMGCGQS